MDTLRSIKLTPENIEEYVSNINCINEQSFSMEKMIVPLKSNAIITPTISFISVIYIYLSIL